jgi:hypothetical protein
MKCGSIVIALLLATSAQAQQTVGADTIEKYVPACIKLHTESQIHRNWIEQGSINVTRFCQCAGKHMVGNRTKGDYDYREQNPGKLTPHEFDLWRRVQDICSSTSKLTVAEVGQRERERSPKLDPRDAEVSIEECEKWFLRQMQPASLYAGRSGAVVCDFAEAVTDYVNTADDPEARRTALLSGYGAPCTMAAPDERYEIADRRLAGGLIGLRKLGTSGQRFGLVAEWQLYPGAVNAKLNAVCQARVKFENANGSQAYTAIRAQTGQNK